MNRIVTFTAGAIAFAIAAVLHWPAYAAEGRGISPSAERGRYIVEGIAGCGDCHTPRDVRGAPLAGRAFKGAPLAFAPIHPMPWASSAPAIAGLPQGWTRAQLASFLRTGVRPNGSRPRPPMPAFRLSAGDAAAVAAYLATVK